MVVCDIEQHLGHWVSIYRARVKKCSLVRWPRTHKVSSGSKSAKLVAGVASRQTFHGLGIISRRIGAAAQDFC